MALDIRIAGRYRLGRKIGSGSFGDIYLGKKPHSDSPCSTIKSFCESAFLAYKSLPAGLHIHTGEEVGIKLVRFGSAFDLSNFTE